MHKKEGVVLILLLILIILATQVSGLKLCSGVSYPDQSCKATEKRIAQVDESGCVKAFSCVNPSQVSGGSSRFQLCSNLPVPKYELACLNPGTPVTENVYRHTDLCQIGVFCFQKTTILTQKCPPLVPAVCPYTHDMVKKQNPQTGCSEYVCEKKPWKYDPIPMPDPNYLPAPGTSSHAPDPLAPGVGGTKPKSGEQYTPIGNLVPQPVASQPTNPTPQTQPTIPSVPTTTSQPNTPAQPQPTTPTIKLESYACGNINCYVNEDCVVKSRECVKKKYRWFGKCTRYRENYGCVKKQVLVQSPPKIPEQQSAPIQQPTASVNPAQPIQNSQTHKVLEEVQAPLQSEYLSQIPQETPIINLDFSNSVNKLSGNSVKRWFRITGKAVNDPVDAIVDYNGYDYNNMRSPTVSPTITKTFYSGGKYLDSTKIPANTRFQVFFTAKNVGSADIARISTRGILYKNGVIIQQISPEGTSHIKPGESQYPGFILLGLPEGNYLLQLEALSYCFDETGERIITCNEPNTANNVLNMQFTVVSQEPIQYYDVGIDYSQESLIFQNNNYVSTSSIKENQPFFVNFRIKNAGSLSARQGYLAQVHTKIIDGTAVEIAPSDSYQAKLQFPGMPAGDYTLTLQVAAQSTEKTLEDNTVKMPIKIIQEEIKPPQPTTQRVQQDHYDIALNYEDIEKTFTSSYKTASSKKIPALWPFEAQIIVSNKGTKQTPQMMIYGYVENIDKYSQIPKTYTKAQVRALDPGERTRILVSFTATPPGNYSVVLYLENLFKDSNFADNELIMPITVVEERSPTSIVNDAKLTYDQDSFITQNDKVVSPKKIIAHKPFNAMFQVINFADKQLHPVIYAKLNDETKKSEPGILYPQSSIYPIFAFSLIPGTYNIDVFLDKFEGETNLENNKVTTQITVVEEEIKPKQTVVKLYQDIDLSANSNAIYNYGNDSIGLNLAINNKEQKLPNLPIILVYGDKKEIMYLNLKEGENLITKDIGVNLGKFPKYLVAYISYEDQNKENNIIKIPVTIQKDGKYYKLA